MSVQNLFLNVLFLNAPFLNSYVDRIGMALIHFLWQGTVIAAVLAVVLRILRRASPQSRYLAAWLALIAMAACLPISAIVFHPVPQKDFAAKDAAPPQNIRPEMPADRTQTDRKINSKNTISRQRDSAANDRENGRLETGQVSRRDSALMPSDAAANHATISPSEDDRVRAAWSAALFAQELQPALRWIVCVWLLGAIALAIWHLSGFRHLRRLIHCKTAPPPADIEQWVVRLSYRMGICRKVSTLVSELARVPTVIGWLRPVILLPSSILGQLSPEQVEMILAHELAHIRRCDYLWNLLQIAIETMLFYHPAMWWVSRQIREERENCCDKEAVGVVGNPQAYARALVRLAEIRGLDNNVVAPAASIAADGGSLESRIRRVLGLPVGSSCQANACFAGLLAVAILATIFCVNLTWAVGSASDDPARTSPAKSDSAAPLSMTVEAFAKLPSAQQRDVLVRSFQQRLDLCKNIFVENEEFDRSYENRNGEPGEPLKKYPGSRVQFRVWRLGDSFRRDTSYDSKAPSGAYSSCESYAVKAEEGLARVAQNYSENDQFKPNGQVMYPHAVLESMNHYHFWLDRQFVANDQSNVREEDHLFRELVNQKDKFEIKIDSKIKLTIPWGHRYGDKSNGKRVMVVDPQRGFLPIQIDSTYEQTGDKGNTAYKELEKVQVTESKRIGEVWMPIKLKEKSFFSLFPDHINVGEISVRHFEVGKVKAADLFVPFTKGMYIQDVVEGVTYTADAQGHAESPVEDAPGWKQEPPPGWHRGKVDDAYSFASRISPDQRKRLVEEREAKSKPIDEALKVLRTAPPVTQEARIEAALKILRVYRIGEREGDWATAIRALIDIGKPAVPKLTDELDRTQSDKTLRALGFVLRGIGDPRAIPALIRAIPRLIQPSGGDYGLTIKDDPGLLRFMWMHDVDHIKKATEKPRFNGLTLFSYESPVTEIMSALEKLTGQVLGWREIRSAYWQAGDVIQLRRQRTLFLQHAQKWNAWWVAHWKNFVADEADAQLEQTQKSIAEFAKTIAAMPQPPLPTEIPCGPLVRIGGGVSWHNFEPYLNLDPGQKAPSKPGELLKKSPKDHPSPELLAWAQREGIDLLRIEIKRPGDNKTYIGYQPVGMKVWKIDNKRMKNLEAELRSSKRLELPELWHGPISSIDRQQGDINEEDAATFLFITRGGSCGTLQIRSGLVRELVEGMPTMGPASLEIQYIFESDSKEKSR